MDVIVVNLTYVNSIKVYIMKKKNIKSLSINKLKISNLNSLELSGGFISTVPIDCPDDSELFPCQTKPGCESIYNYCDEKSKPPMVCPIDDSFF